MKKKLRTVAVMLALALPISLLAQGGMFQRGIEPEGVRSSYATALTNQGFGNPINGSILTNQNFSNPNGGGSSLTNQIFSNPIGGGSSLTNQTFGVPISNGLFIMLIGGIGYATLKLKKNKKNNNNRKENKQ